MSKPKSTTPDIELDGLLDTSFNCKESFLKAFSLCGDATEACRQADISPLTLEKFKASDSAFVQAMKQLTQSLAADKAKRTKLINSAADTLRNTLKTQGLYSPLSELYIDQYASVRYDLTQLEDARTSHYYDATAKGNLEALVKARRSELSNILKTLTSQKATKQSTQDSHLSDLF